MQYRTQCLQILQESPHPCVKKKKKILYEPLWYVKLALPRYLRVGPMADMPGYYRIITGGVKQMEF